MITTDFSYQKPKELTELFEALESEESTLLAGGTDLLVALGDEKRTTPLVLDIKAIPELKGIYEEGDRIFIGATETMHAVLKHPLLQSYGALMQGVGHIGCYEIRCRATIGGNICNGSPSADSVPGLLLYDAEVVLLSKEGTRREDLSDFLLGPGKVDLNPGEILKGVSVPKASPNAQSCYFRASRVKGMDLSGVSVSVYSANQSDFRIALGAVWPTVARAHTAESVLNSAPFSEELVNQALSALSKEINPREGSLRATPEYKRAMVEHYIRKGIGLTSKGGQHG